MSPRILLQVIATTWIATSCNAGVSRDKLAASAPGNIHIEGWLGEKIELCLNNRVMVQDIERLVKPFRERGEEDSMRHWRCDYWGRWCTAAANGYAYKPIPANRAQFERGVNELLATQSPDGYIGTNKPDKHLLAWDVWGRKRTLLGLIAGYDLTGNKAALNAAIRVADHLLKEAPPGKVNLTATGMDLVKGLPPSSILEPFALLYQRTGERRYLELANDIVACWGKPNVFAAHGLQFRQRQNHCRADVNYTSLCL